MARKKKAEVLVVGGGPAGMLTALLLGQRGVDVRVVDQGRRSSRNNYALALHPASLELLDRIGVAEELVGRGRRINVVAFYEGTQPRLRLALEESGGKFPFVLVLPQRALEEALKGRLKRQKIRIDWKHRVEALREEEGRTTAQVAVMDQVSSGYPIARLDWVKLKSYEIEARFVVGADGYHSFVRQSLDIGFRELSPRETFNVFEFDSPGATVDEARVVLHGDSVNMLWPMPGDRYRWTFHADRAGQPTVEELNTLIRERAPWFPEVRDTLHWSAAVHFDRRLAEEFGRGRVWLAGDAAHLTYPMGNQSVNGGLADAEALSNRLAPLLREEGQPGVALEAYSRERLEAWNRTLDPSEELDFGGEPWISRSAPYFLASLPGTDRALREQLARLGLA